MAPDPLPPNYDESRIRRFIAQWRAAGCEDTPARAFLGALCGLLGVEAPSQRSDDERSSAGSIAASVVLAEPEPLARRSQRTLDRLREAHAQARGRARSEAGERPSALVACDCGRAVWLWHDLAAAGKDSFEAREEFTLADLSRPQVFQRLQWALSDPQRLDPGRESSRVTQAITRSLGRLVARLQARMQGDAGAEVHERIARFTMACVFTRFAEDLDLLPDRGFHAAVMDRWQERPGRFAPEVSALWERMAAGGADRRAAALQRLGAAILRAPALALQADELAALAEAVRHDWSVVEPAIFGTLLEQSLRARERARLGAHFTPRAFIERVIRPTILEPLRVRWQRIHAEALSLAREAADADAPARMERARGLCRGFLGELGEVRVLDPACGTGNFLYVAMDLIQRLEEEVQVALRDLGEASGALTTAFVRPDRFLGIEKAPWSRAIAGLVLAIGYLQRRRARDEADPSDLNFSCDSNIAVGDAILEFDAEQPVLDGRGRPAIVTRQGKPGQGSRAALRRCVGGRATVWPDVDFIVSNPPFIGNKRMRELLGDGYAEAVRVAYGEGAEALPGDVDYVAYWWHKAALRLREPGTRLRRFGLITTNSVCQRQSGAVLRRHLGRGVTLQFACPDHPWVDPTEELGSAAVRISMTVARRDDEPGAGETCFLEDLDSRRGGRGVRARAEAGAPAEDGARAVRLRETRGRRINPDLTIGADLTAARPLAANANLCFQGMNLVGDGFRLTPEDVERLLGPSRERPAVLRRYVRGQDLKAAPSLRHVIDFFGLDEAAAQAAAPELFAHLRRSVQPLRARNSREAYARRWWLFGEPRPGLRRALAGLTRYIATPETSAHRFFVLLDADIVPDHQIYVIARADEFMLGVLSSRAHTEWALRAGGSNGIGNDSRWSSTATFLPFPFPDPPPAERRRIGVLAARLERARRAILARCPGVSLTELYHGVEALRAGRAAAAQRWAPILRLHEALDHAVLAAYRFPADVATDELLRRLLALNHARAERDAARPRPA